jgi:hypothetical protein
LPLGKYFPQDNFQESNFCGDLTRFGDRSIATISHRFPTCQPVIKLTADEEQRSQIYPYLRFNNIIISITLNCLIHEQQR